MAATVPVVEARSEPGYRRLTAQVPDFWMRYLSLKGFVALNGASLTIAELDREASTISVSLIPETLARTTFGDVRTGDRLNLEVDAQTPDRRRYGLVDAAGATWPVPSQRPEQDSP